MNQRFVYVDGANSGVIKQGDGDSPITNVVGNSNVVGDRNVVNSSSVEKIAEIIAGLQEAAKVLPKEQRDVVESDLEDLQAELEKSSEEQQPKKIKRYLKGLVAAVAAVLVGMGVASEQIKTISTNAVDIVGNTATIAEEVQRIRDNSTEFKALSPSDQEVIATVGVFSDKLGQIAEEYKLPAE